MALITSQKRVWTGRTLSSLAVLFLLFDGVVKFFPIAAVTDSFAQLGFPAELAVTIAVIELACLALYVIPRTAILGAVLLTGYFGGAIATHVRVGNPLFSHVLFPTYVAALIWVGLYLRHESLRAFVRSAVLGVPSRESVVPAVSQR